MIALKSIMSTFIVTNVVGGSVTTGLSICRFLHLDAIVVILIIGINFYYKSYLLIIITIILDA